MAIIKPPVLPPWADAGDKVQPSNAELQVGWPLSSVPPARQRFNWILNYLANAVRYFSRRGIPDYDVAETYMTGDRIIGDDGKTYRSLIDTNLAQTPSTSPTKWEEWAPTLSRFAALIQGQTYTAFTTAGAAPNFTLTPSPAIAAYAAGQRFRVKFHAVGTGADVLNVCALGNKSLKQYDSTGAKVAAVIAANQLADVEYDGVDMVVMDPLPPAASQGNFAGLASTNVSATLALSDMGKLYAFYGSTAAQILTLPAVATVAQGKNAIIVNQGSVPVTVKGNASENISINSLGVGQVLANTMVLNPGDSITLSSNGAAQWNAFGMAQPLYGYMLVQDQKANGTNGGTSVVGTQTRVLNTVVNNTIYGASLASNQITLPAGTYRIKARAPVGSIDGNQAVFFNVTDTTSYFGSSNDGLSGVQSWSLVDCRFTIASAKVFELRHWTNVAVASGLGYNASAGNTEVYSQVEIIKEL
jgi:hypothetical protein